MNKEDRSEIRELLNDVMIGHTNEMRGRFNVIHANLIDIKDQTTKTNGRVNKAEDDIHELKEINLLHTVRCPNTQKIIDLEKTEYSRKSVLKFGAKIGAVAGTVFALIIALLQLIQKL